MTKIVRDYDLSPEQEEAFVAQQFAETQNQPSLTTYINQINDYDLSINLNSVHKDTEL